MREAFTASGRGLRQNAGSREARAAASVVAIAPADIATKRDPMLRFTSLGDNCEFGIAQRAFGAEPLDLFRWASTPLPVLVKLLRNRLAGIGDPKQLPVFDRNGELMVDHLGHRFRWHAFAYTARTSPEAVQRRETLHLARLGEILVEHLTAGDRILVVKGEGSLSRSAVESLLEAVRSYAAIPAALRELATGGARPGSAEALDGGLYRGYFGKFAEYVPHTDAPAWLPLCGSAVAPIDGKPRHTNSARVPTGK